VLAKLYSYLARSRIARKGLALAAVAFCVTSSTLLQAAAPPPSDRDDELRQRLIGTWEIDLPEKFFPLKKAYSTYRADGTFDQIAVFELGGRVGSAAVHGEWQVKSGMLHERATRGMSGLIGNEETSKIISIDQARFIQRDREGVKTMRRGQIPSNLVPLSRFTETLVRGAQQLTATAIATPKPEYPYDARRDQTEGRGLFRLVVNAAGTVDSAEAWQSTRSAQLDKAATAALKQWRFKPGTRRDGLVPIVFTMHGN